MRNALLVVWNRLVRLWREEPAVLRSGIAGALGLTALLLGATWDVSPIVDSILNILGLVVILASGFAARPAVTPYHGEGE